MSTSSSGISLDVNEFPGKRVLVTGGTKGAIAFGLDARPSS